MKKGKYILMTTRDVSEPSTPIYALLLKLRPLTKGTLMPFSGQLVHGAWLQWMKHVSPDIAQYIHNGNKRRPFTCSSVQFPVTQERLWHAQRENIHLPLDEKHIYTMRLTLLHGELFPLLYETVMHMNLRSPLTQQMTIQIGKQQFALEEMVTTPDDPSGWTGHTTYTGLVILAQRQRYPSAYPLTLEFASLTAFNRMAPINKKYGSYYAQFPLPQYVFLGLATRWRELVPPKLASVIQKERIETYIAEEGIIVDDYQIHTHQIHFADHPQRGFIGMCRYVLRGPDEPPTEESPLTVRQQLHLLSWLAFYTGVGTSPTMGMGQVRLVPSR